MLCHTQSLNAKTIATRSCPVAIATTDPNHSPLFRIPKATRTNRLLEWNHARTTQVMFRGQWIELYNPTDTTVDLSTYSLHSQNDTGSRLTKITHPTQVYISDGDSKQKRQMVDCHRWIMYNHAILKILRNDWIELRNGTEVVDRWRLTVKSFEGIYDNAMKTEQYATQHNLRWRWLRFTKDNTLCP